MSARDSGNPLDPHRGAPSPASSRGSADPLTVGVVVESFPVPTETFLLTELEALREAGVRAEVLTCSSREPPSEALLEYGGIRVRRARRRSWAAALACTIRCVFRRPRRSIAAARLAGAAGGPSLRRGVRALRAFATACGICEELGAGEYDVLHAQFINRPALVACFLSTLTGTPCSISAHARDVFVPDFRLAPLVSASRFTVVCSSAAYRHLLTQMPASLQGRVRCLHHGLDLEPFVARVSAPEPPSCPEGSRARPVRVLTISRLVPKKDVGTVVRAVAILNERGWNVRLLLVGDGPGRASVLRLAESSRVVIEHRLRASPREIRRWMSESDALLLGCSTGPDGDRDGLPNVVLEAMAAGLPVVTTGGGSVGDAVTHRVTGLLAPAGDPVALADALTTMLSDGEMRRRIVDNAGALVRSCFDARQNVRPLLELLAAAGWRK